MHITPETVQYVTDERSDELQCGTNPIFFYAPRRICDPEGAALGCRLCIRFIVSLLRLYGRTQRLSLLTIRFFQPHRLWTQSTAPLSRVAAEASTRWFLGTACEGSGATVLFLPLPVELTFEGAEKAIEHA
jgi:hypothetical protein